MTKHMFTKLALAAATLAVSMGAAKADIYRGEQYAYVAETPVAYTYAAAPVTYAYDTTPVAYTYATAPVAYNTGYYDAGYTMPVALTTGGYANDYVAAWQPLALRSIPVRFGSLGLREDVVGSAMRYTVAFNGQTLLSHDGLANALSVSPAFHLSHEDVVVLTFATGKASCPFNHFLISTRDDGTAPAPRIIDSCGPMHAANVDANVLHLSFPRAINVDALTMWDEWTYGNSALKRI